MQIVANIDGKERVIAVFDGLFFGQDKVHRFADLVGSEMVERTSQRFETQTDPYGSPWLPSQRAIKQGGETLRDTGRMYDSLHWKLLPDGVEWGTARVEYAPHVHFGTKNMVGRKFLGMNADDVDFVNQTLRTLMGDV